MTKFALRHETFQIVKCTQARRGDFEIFTHSAHVFQQTKLKAALVFVINMLSFFSGNLSALDPSP